MKSLFFAFYPALALGLLLLLISLGTLEGAGLLSKPLNTSTGEDIGKPSSPELEAFRIQQTRQRAAIEQSQAQARRDSRWTEATKSNSKGLQAKPGQDRR